MTDRPTMPDATEETDPATQAAAMREAFPRGLGGPALRALAAAGLTSLEQVTSVTEAGLLRMHGMGPKAVRILRDALQLRGLTLRP
jgi:hypothetical protein